MREGSFFFLSCTLRKKVDNKHMCFISPKCRAGETILLNFDAELCPWVAIQQLRGKLWENKK